MNKFALNIIRDDSLVELLQTDGTKLTGIICNQRPEVISIRQEDGNLIDITQDMISKALYFYIGYPRGSVVQQIPNMISPNGKIEYYNANNGLAINSEGIRLVVHPDSFLFDDILKINANNEANKIEGQDVLLVMREVNGGIIKKAYLLSVDTVDNTLDKIVSLAASGKIDLAAAFCQQLMREESLRNDPDLKRFYEELTNPIDIVDYYKPIQNSEQEDLARKEKRLFPLGRIFDVTRNYDGSIKEGHIIDVASHEKLFFFGKQLFGKLADMPDELLISHPVVYSISSSKAGKGYQARSIMMPMKYSDAYSMAEDMHYDNTMPVNACDILRILLSQTEDDDLEQDLDEWSQGTNVRGKLWVLTTPRPYIGQPQKLINSPHDKPSSIILERQISHTHEETHAMTLPEQPIIILREGMSEVDKKQAEEVLKNREERIDVKDDKKVKDEKGDIISQAKEYEIQKEYEKAIELYLKILNGSTKTKEKGDSIRCIVNLYSKLCNSILDEKQRKETIEKYRDFAREYLEGANNKGYWLKERNLQNLDCLIQYYNDINETNELIRSYKDKIALLEKHPQTEDEERNSILSLTRIELAWVYILAGEDSNKIKTLLKEARKDSAYDNQLGRICNAVIEEQEDSISAIRNDVSFIEHQPITNRRSLSDEISHWNKIISLSGPYSKDRNIDKECFVLLAKIYVYSLRGNNSKTKVIEPLCQYLIAILSKDMSQYEIEQKRWLSSKTKAMHVQQIYDSCLAEKLSDCLNKNSSGMWRHWKDIRLVAALSRDAAYKLCTLLFNLNAEAFTEVMRLSGVSIKEKDVCNNLTTFAKNFNEWRGIAYFENYKKLRTSTRELVNNTMDMTRCANFLKNELKYEAWMQQADSKLVNLMHDQLASLLTDYLTASDGSRKRVKTSQEIMRRVDIWKKDIEKTPTFLSHMVLEYLLTCVHNIIKNKISSYQEPHFKCKVISTSLVKPDGSLRIEVEITNEESKSKQVTDCRLMVLNNDVKEFRTSKIPYTFDDNSNVFSGEHIIYIVQGKLPLSMQSLPTGKLRLRLIYRIDEGKKEKSNDFVCDFPIKLWSKDSPTIDNVYVPGKPAHNHFYGRDDQVREIVSAISSSNSAPHYFIYGQKRSGKSSMLYHIKKNLEAKNKYLCIELDFSRIGNAINREEDIYYEILQKIRFEFMLNYNFHINKESDKDKLPMVDMPERAEMSVDLFCTIMGSIKRMIASTKGWEDYHIVLFIDEFTTVYEWCKDTHKMVTEAFFTHWKSIQSTGLFSAVLIGQDILRDIMNVAVENDLSGYCFMKLDYLKREDARLVITQPIIALTGNSDIFVGESIERILDYTASSAYYTKHVCHELINHINSNSLQVITEADVEETIREFLMGDSQQIQLLFDPLEFSGRSTKESDFKKIENHYVMQKVAQGELADREFGCSRTNINLEDKGISDKRVDEILAELVDRNVLIEKYNYYTLNVKLYLLWTS